MANNLSHKIYKKAGLSRFFFVIYFIFCTTLLFSQNSSKYLKTLKQPAGNLYYATPIKLKSTEQKTDLEIDFTLFYHKDSSNQVLIHTSLYSKTPLERPDSVLFTFSDNKINTNTPKLLFVEQIKGKWHYRHESVVSFQEYQKITKKASDLQSITFFFPDQKISFLPNKKFQKAGPIIYEIMRAEMGF